MNDDLTKIFQKLNSINKKITLPLNWLTVSELAGYLKVSESYIRKLIARGELPFKRVGTSGKIVFHRKEVDLYLLNNCQKPTKRDRETYKDLL